MHKIILTFLLCILIITFPSLAQDDQNQKSNKTLSDLPQDMWGEIFSWINNGYGEEPWITNDKERALRYLDAIKNIVPLTYVNKEHNKVGNVIIENYLEKIRRAALYTNIDEMLYSAVYEWEFSLVKFCCKLGADINTTKFKKTFLIRAIKRQCYPIVKILLNYGADPTHPNNNGKTPIDLAYQDGSFGIARLLKKRGGDPDKKYYLKGKRGKIIKLQNKNKERDQTQKNKESSFDESDVVLKESLHAKEQLKTNSKSSSKSHTSILSLLFRNKLVLFGTGITIGAFIGWLCKRNTQKNKNDVIENKITSKDLNSIFTQEFERRSKFQNC